MIINIDNMKQELSKINKILSDYEYTYLNMYNEFSSVPSIWRGNVAQRFSNKVGSYKLKIKTSLEEFKSLADVYQYIIDSYEKIGKKCRYDISQRDSVLKQIELYKNSIKKIYQQYIDLGTDFDNNIKIYIDKEIRKVSEILTKIDSLYCVVKEFYSDVFEINKEVKLKLSKLSIDDLDNIEMNDFV